MSFVIELGVSVWTRALKIDKWSWRKILSKLSVFFNNLAPCGLLLLYYETIKNVRRVPSKGTIYLQCLKLLKEKDTQENVAVGHYISQLTLYCLVLLPDSAYMLFNPCRFSRQAFQAEVKYVSIRTG